jgi:hypothetical protein
VEVCKNESIHDDVRLRKLQCIVAASQSLLLEETHELVVTPEILSDFTGRDSRSGNEQLVGRDGAREWSWREFAFRAGGRR